MRMTLQRWAVAAALGAAVAGWTSGGVANAQTVLDPFWVYGPAPRVGIAPAAPPTSTRSFGGRVQSVAPRKGTLRIFDYATNETYRLKIDRKTQVVDPRGRPVGLEQLRPGAQVRADFDLKRGHMVAQRVEVVGSQ